MSADVIQLVKDALLPAFEAEAKRLLVVDNWARWSHDQPHAPRQSTLEYRQLADRSHTPWLSLPITAVSQQLYVEAYRQAREPDDDAAWQAWQANSMDARQIAIHRAALTYGTAYGTVLPGVGPDGPMPAIRGVSPRKMLAFYADPAEDDFPLYALRCDVSGDSYRIRLYDAETVTVLRAPRLGGEVELVSEAAHGMNVCPVVRYANALDLDGRSPGEVEPLIPLAARIDQTVFDRLVVQRFASWIVRTIAGMTKPETAEAAQAEKLRLRVEDILVAEDPETRFGSLPATPLDGFIAAKEADLKDLAAISQTPAHHLLGSSMSNMSAEALAAAEANLSRKIEERKHSFGESHEQLLRLASEAMGLKPDFAAQVQWRDMESRSLAATADALGKLGQMLGVPVELLWEKIPGWTQTDVERAKSLRAEGDSMGLLASVLNPAA